jgi:uncharacterized membrane protein
VKAKFPTFFSEEVKKAGIARDSTFLIATAGMATVVAGMSLMFAPVDPSGASAAGFFIAASTALRSTTALWTARINKEEFIKKAQAELRQRLSLSRFLCNRRTMGFVEIGTGQIDTLFDNTHR